MKYIWSRPLAAACALAIAGLGANALAGDDKAISAGKLARDASKFYGKTVTVSAEVEDVLDDHSFTLDEDALLAGHDVLVLLPQGKARQLRHDEKVMVTGQVRRYVVAELDRDFDWFEEGRLVKKEVKVDYSTRPVLVATQVTTASGALLSEAAGTGDSDVPTPSTRPQQMALISATTLVNAPKDFYGQTVSVQAEVEEVLSPNSFTLDEDAVFKGPDVLVLVPGRVAERLRKDEKVTVTGIVRPWVVADLDRDLEFFEEGTIVKTKTKVDWKTRPVIVASAVLTPDGRDLLKP